MELWNLLSLKIFARNEFVFFKIHILKTRRFMSVNMDMGRWKFSCQNFLENKVICLRCILFKYVYYLIINTRWSVHFVEWETIPFWVIYIIHDTTDTRWIDTKKLFLLRLDKSLVSSEWCHWSNVIFVFNTHFYHQQLTDKKN